MNRIPVLVLAAAGMLAVPAFAGTLAYQSPRTTYEPPVEASQTIIVTAPRNANDDYLINTDVANTIADDRTIRGHVETQTYRNVVTLGGRVTTPGMVDRVERDARSVDGVVDVENLVRPAVGGQ
jgi:hypothetical protein